MLHVVPFHVSAKVTPPENPTDLQALVAVQATPDNPLLVVPDGFGVVTMLQIVPSQDSSSVMVVPPFSDNPMAIQALVAVHDTPLNCTELAPAGLEVVSTLQVVPFQTSAPPEVPTAVHALAAVQATPESATTAPDGVGWRVHVVPFQDSTRGSSALLIESPTAVQVLILRHDTPASALKKAPEGLGLLSMTHEVPSHDSTSELVPPL
jgi:hypothetical protein